MQRTAELGELTTAASAFTWSLSVRLGPRFMAALCITTYFMYYDTTDTPDKPENQGRSW